MIGMEVKLREYVLRGEQRGEERGGERRGEGRRRMWAAMS